MSTAQIAYLGWELLEHAEGCRRPVWTVDVRTESEYRPRRDGAGHDCPNENCAHGDRFEATTVRIVCSSCGTAHLLTADSERVRRRSTAALGYGQQPRRVAGLWLWPDEPLLSWGRGKDEEPWGYLATRQRVDRVTAADVVGEILQGRGKRGGVVWSAAAVPSQTGRHGVGPVRWATATTDLRSVAAAAKWIATQLALAEAGGESR